MPKEFFIIAIVLIVVFGGVVMQWIKNRFAQESKDLSEEVSRKLKKMDKLEQRVRVLEKIVTNKKVKLAEEIESL